MPSSPLPPSGGALLLCLLSASSLCGEAVAASLDNLEVGGAWGTPGATDATAIWWNPAGLAAGHGTRITLEGAPTFATIDIERADPNGGADTIKLSGVVPFAGVATDLGIRGLGLGGGLAVPYVRGGEQDPADGPVRYHLREGHIQGVTLIAGGGYSWRDMVAVGAGLHVIMSSWSARVDNELLPDLADEIAATGQDPGYTDEMLEDPDYAATLDFDQLQDTAITWSAGLRLTPLEQLTISLTHVAGAWVDNAGDVSMAFSCPPQDDVLGRFGAEAQGICDTTLQARAMVSYALPARWHGSVLVRPSSSLRIEAMGGLVLWSAHDDYDVVIDGVAELNPDLPEATVELVEREQAWARDNQDSFWLGLDVKGTLVERLTLGGRVLYDKAAVPDQALIANNFDTDTVTVGGLVAGKVWGPLELGLSWSHYFLATRTVTDSAFSMSVDPALRPADRYNYPHGNGTYGGSIDRLGLSARVAL